MNNLHHSSAYEMDAIQTSIPRLPDDLMLMIFGELTTEERDQVGSSCRRFREIDFELGKRRFYEIHIELISSYETMHITGFTPKTKYIVEISKKNSDPDHKDRVFRKASTDFLIIMIDRNKNKNDSAFYRYMQSFFERIRFKSLIITVNSDQACSESLRSMIINHKRCYNQVCLKFSNSEADSFDDVLRTRTLLIQLPKIYKFKLDWGKYGEVRDKTNLDYLKLIDDNTLLHIAKNTKRAELGNSNCSAQGMLNAFQVICSPEEKCASIEFETSLSTVDEFLRNLGIGTSIYYGVDRFYKEPQSQSKIRFSVNRATIRGNAVVTMTKSSINKEIVDWYD